MALAIAHAAATSAARALSLPEALRRVGGYVQAYGEQASIVVATERYAQDEASSREPAHSRHRALVSEFAIVYSQDVRQWLGFRDVIQVDGQPITDHQDRLIHLLTSPSGLSDARVLSDEGARFNLGPLSRNFNVPTSALFMFSPENLSRFRFSRAAILADGTWQILFRESRKPTLIRTPTGGSVPAAGAIWVNPLDGTVQQTRLTLHDFKDLADVRGASIEIDVVYSRVPRLGMWLPETMREAYDVVGRGDWDRTSCRADYSNYRRFETTARIK